MKDEYRQGEPETHEIESGTGAAVLIHDLCGGPGDRSDASCLEAIQQIRGSFCDHWAAKLQGPAGTVDHEALS